MHDGSADAATKTEHESSRVRTQPGASAGRKKEKTINTGGRNDFCNHSCL